MSFWERGAVSKRETSSSILSRQESVGVGSSLPGSSATQYWDSVTIHPSSGLARPLVSGAFFCYLDSGKKRGMEWKREETMGFYWKSKQLFGWKDPREREMATVSPVLCSN